MIHILSWTFEELGRAMNKSLEVEIGCCITRGSAGSYWEPPEPDEIEFFEVTIVEFLSDTDEIEVDHSWQRFLKDIAFRIIESNRDRLEEELLERLDDADEAARDDYYDRKRDEQRGC